MLDDRTHNKHTRVQITNPLELFPWQVRLLLYRWVDLLKIWYIKRRLRMYNDLIHLVFSIGKYNHDIIELETFYVPWNAHSLTIIGLIVDILLPQEFNKAKESTRQVIENAHISFLLCGAELNRLWHGFCLWHLPTELKVIREYKSGAKILELIVYIISQNIYVGRVDPGKMAPSAKMAGPWLVFDMVREV